MSTFAGSPPTGPKGGAAPGAAGAVTVGPTERGAGPSGMYGQCLCHGAVGQPSARKGHISALNCTRCGGLNVSRLRSRTVGALWPYCGTVLDGRYERQTATRRTGEDTLIKAARHGVDAAYT